MNTHFYTLLLIILIPFFSILSAFASQNGQISGTVTDTKTGENIIGANIIVINSTLGASSDSIGRYTILELKPGKYNLKCQLIGYGPEKIHDVEVKSNEITKVDFSLTQVKVEDNESTIIVPSSLENKSNPSDVDPYISIGEVDNSMDPEITIADPDNSVDPDITLEGTESLPFNKRDSLKVRKKILDSIKNKK